MTTKKTSVAATKKSPLKKVSALARPDVKATTTQTFKVSPQQKSKKEHKIKVVRDSFTMPQSEYQKISDIKAVCLKAKMHVKKSEVLRAGLKVLANLNPAQLKLALSSLEKIKTGRPKQH